MRYLLLLALLLTSCVKDSPLEPTPEPRKQNYYLLFQHYWMSADKYDMQFFVRDYADTNKTYYSWHHTGRLMSPYVSWCDSGLITWGRVDSAEIWSRASAYGSLRSLAVFPDGRHVGSFNLTAFTLTDSGYVLRIICYGY